VFKVITDAQALANAVVSGQVDVAGQLDPTTVDLVKSRKSIAQVGGTIVGFPVADKTGATNPAFAKPQVRLALSYAIDRATLVKQLHPGRRRRPSCSRRRPPGSTRR
jgi:peptide/nickel transport system substrate-binding protein